ncbi:ankyrin repeat domain-containing protein 11 isoform X4 [Dendroctonus ponderosae]|uniref:Ankyrin repeat domain-containing protein 12 n=1 Tax=Dendroctonus ponderosae TaxID=77166 RepID=A0AAR5PXV6_DENPD|nr:ankyrin repeat domain-containing protein 11 isoform X4 [Dendroctonus ponderosae]
MPANVRPKGSNTNTRAPPVTPMSERQQMALLMQMTSSGEGSRSPSNTSSKTRDRNERGWTPLHEACNHGWHEVAARLVQAGANINAKGLDNDTPLHDAVINGHLKIIKLLIEKGADIHVKNSKGKSPLDLASPSIQPYLLNTDMPLPEAGSSSSTRVPLRSRDDKKVSSASTDKQKTGSSTSSSESMDAKSNSTAEDIYEFKSVKDADSAAEKKSENTESEMSNSDSLSVPTSTTNEDSTKRAYGEVEGNDDSEKDEDNKKKKRKDDTAKETGKTTQRGQNKGQSSKQSVSATGKHAAASSSKASASADKKSPDGSPKPTVSNNSASDVEGEGSSNSGDGKTDLKVPPLKIVIPQSSTNEQDTGTSRNGKNASQRVHQALPYVVASSNSNDSSDKETALGTNSPDSTGNSKDNDKKEAPSTQTDEQASKDTEAENNTAANTSTTTASAPAATHVELHPRKRKMKQSRSDQASAQQATDNAESSTESREVHPHEQPITNCYKLFMNIRKQIEKRRKGLFLVQPKPPQGFKDYLMNRCTYVLANTAPTTPTINYPPSLPGQLKELFAEQEKERYRLRMQHVIEKEKLVLAVEQEILRVHGRAARALANQSLPFSVSTVLRDEEIYNLITPEQEEKDRNARPRYNGRLFLSWLQDVDDKWEKIKEHMLVRHHNEADSLRAVQKMNWEWKLKELSLGDKKLTPKIDELHVPEVHVSDDFDLLPT